MKTIQLFRRILLCLICCGVLLVVAIWFSFGFVSVCGECGALQNTTDLQVPLLAIRVYRWPSPAMETPISQAAQKAGVDKYHKHRWLFAHGGSTMPFSCALGPGSSLLSTVRNEELARFIQATAEFKGETLANVWLGRALDPDQSSNVRSFTTDFPPAGFQTAEEYDSWLERANRLYAEDWVKK